jgi:hypothetical protein
MRNDRLLFETCYSSGDAYRQWTWNGDSFTNNNGDGSDWYINCGLNGSSRPQSWKAYDGNSSIAIQNVGTDKHLAVIAAWAYAYWFSTLHDGTYRIGRYYSCSYYASGPTFDFYYYWYRTTGGGNWEKRRVYFSFINKYVYNTDQNIMFLDYDRYYTFPIWPYGSAVIP